MTHNNILNEVKDIVNGIDVNNLLISANSVVFSYEHGNLDEGDLYSLMRDVVDIASIIGVLKDTVRV